LLQLDFWLSRDGASRIILAEPTMKALQNQDLPAHVRITLKKRAENATRARTEA
jgi:hypothetical protein